MEKRRSNIREQPDLHDNGRVLPKRIALRATGRYAGIALAGSFSIQSEAATSAKATLSRGMILVTSFIPGISLKTDDPTLR